MALGKIMNGAKDKTIGVTGNGGNVMEKMKDIGENAQEKIEQLFDEYKKIIPVVNDLGFAIDNFNVGMGLTPKVKTAIIGSINKIQEENVNKLITENENQKLLISLLKAILTAKKFKDHLDNLPFNGVKINMTLGIPPAISMDFIK